MPPRPPPPPTTTAPSPAPTLHGLEPTLRLADWGVEAAASPTLDSPAASPAPSAELTADFTDGEGDGGGGVDGPGHAVEPTVVLPPGLFAEGGAGAPTASAPALPSTTSLARSYYVRAVLAEQQLAAALADAAAARADAARVVGVVAAAAATQPAAPALPSSRVIVVRPGAAPAIAVPAPGASTHGRVVVVRAKRSALASPPRSARPPPAKRARRATPAAAAAAAPASCGSCGASSGVLLSCACGTTTHPKCAGLARAPRVFVWTCEGCSSPATAPASAARPRRGGGTEAAAAPARATRSRGAKK